MFDMPPALLRLKAETCRLLTDTAENVVRNAIWLDRADYWDKLAKETEALLNAANSPTPPWPPAGQPAPSGS